MEILEDRLARVRVRRRNKPKRTPIYNSLVRCFRFVTPHLRRVVFFLSSWNTAWFVWAHKREESIHRRSTHHYPSKRSKTCTPTRELRVCVLPPKVICYICICSELHIRLVLVRMKAFIRSASRLYTHGLRVPKIACRQSRLCALPHTKDHTARLFDRRLLACCTTHTHKSSK